VEETHVSRGFSTSVGVHILLGTSALSMHRAGIAKTLGYSKNAVLEDRNAREVLWVLAP
jgi:hypothetical protein